MIASRMGKGYETHQARVLALQGLGKDLEKAGEKTQEAADAVRKKL